MHVAGRLNAHAIIHNSGWLLFDKLVRLLLGLLVGAWVARYLGPSQYGQLAYVLAFLTLFQAVVSLGLDSIVVRDLALHHERAPVILGTAVALRLFCGFCAWILAGLGMALLNGWGDSSVLLVLVAGSSLVFQAGDTIDLWFQSQSQSRRTVVAKLAAYFVSNSVKVTLILAQAPLIAFAAVLALEALTASIALIIAYRGYPCGRRWRSAGAQGRAFIRESWPFIFSGLAIWAYMRIDQLMIKKMLGEEALGLYAAMLPVSSLWHVIPVALCISLAPFVATKRLQNEADYYRALTIIFRTFLFLGIGLSVVTSFASQTLVNILYGSAYGGSAKILQIHVFCNIPVFLGVAQGLWFANEKKAGLMLRNTLLGAGVSIGANYLLLPVMGLTGAAISAVISYFVSGILANIVGAKMVFLMQLGFNPFKNR